MFRCSHKRLFDAAFCKLNAERLTEKIEQRYMAAHATQTCVLLSLLSHDAIAVAVAVAVVVVGCYYC